MRQRRSSFPKGFLWGASTSAHQVEGGLHNDWVEWEQKHAVRLAREAEARNRQKQCVNPELLAAAASPNNYISGLACDHYCRYPEDFRLA